MRKGTVPSSKMVNLGNLNFSTLKQEQHKTLSVRCLLPNFILHSPHSHFKEEMHKMLIKRKAAAPFLGQRLSLSLCRHNARALCLPAL